MARLEATGAMRAALPDAKAKASEAMDKRAREAGFQSHADYLDRKRQARRDADAKRQAAAVKSPEWQAANERIERLIQIQKDLGKSMVGQHLDAFTMMVRGIEIDGPMIRAMSPSAELYRLYKPTRGVGLIELEELAAGSHYAYLNDATKVGCSSYDLSDPRVQGGGGGDTEMSMINHMHAATAFKLARQALGRCVAHPRKAVQIRQLVDWVCLDGGRPLDDFRLAPEKKSDGTPERVRASKATMIAIGLASLGQHFLRGTG